jgi:hypothetical protein
MQRGPGAPSGPASASAGASSGPHPDRAAFRRDRYLRSSPWHLLTWSLAAFAFQWRMGLSPHPLDPGLAGFAFALVAGSLLTSHTHERRCGKMFGPADRPVFAGAGRLWTVVFAAMAAGSAAVLSAGRPLDLVTVWMGGAGLGFAAWGAFAGFRPWLLVGLALLVATALDLAWSATPGLVGEGLRRLWLRSAVLALFLPASAVFVIRRYGWR